MEAYTDLNPGSEYQKLLFFLSMIL